MRLNPNDFADAFEAGDFLIRYCKPGNRTAEIEPGTVDVSGLNPAVGMNWHMPPGTKIDMHEFACLTSRAEDVGDGCCFQLNDGVEILGGGLLAPVKSQKHVCCVGIAGHRSYNGISARIKGTSIGGGNFQFYAWDENLRDGYFILENCWINGGRWLVTNGNSGGSNASTIELHNCHLRGDWSLGWSDPASALGARLHGISGRGGTTRMFGGSIVMLGGADATDVRGAWTPLAQSPPGRQSDYEGGHPDALIDLVGASIRVDGKGAKNAQEVEQGVGRIVEKR